ATPEGTVELVLHPGPPLPFTEPLDLTPHPVRAGTLSRYEPFKAGDPFKMNQLTLAGRRIEEEGVASSAIYLPHCVPGKKPGEAPKMQVERTLSFGPKRLWDIGVGASTEEYPIAIFRWKNSRIWSSSSQLEVHGYASHLRQTAGVNLHWYYDNSNPRLYLEPSYKIEHRTERNYETFETTASVMAGKLIDVGEWTLIPEGGMTLHRLHVVGDLLPSRTDMFVSPGARLEARSNDYE